MSTPGGARPAPSSVSSVHVSVTVSIDSKKSNQAKKPPAGQAKPAPAGTRPASKRAPSSSSSAESRVINVDHADAHIDRKQESPDPHDALVLIGRNFSFRRLSCWQGFCLIIFTLLLLPVLLEMGSISFVLGLLIPLGYIFGLMEHHVPVLWLLFVAFIQAGGVMDIGSDLLLLAKMFVYEKEQEESGEHGENEWDELEGVEAQLFWARLFLTVFGCIPGYFFLWFMRGVGQKIVDAGMGRASTEDKKSSSSRIPPMGAAFVVIIMAAAWKLCMLGLRLYLVFTVLIALFRHRKLIESAKIKAQWIELVLYVDLMCSGLPLGIVTFLEVTIYSKDGFWTALDQDKILELVKLGALAIDLVGAAYLFWFVLVGLAKKMHGGHDHKHGHGEEAKGLLKNEH